MSFHKLCLLCTKNHRPYQLKCHNKDIKYFFNMFCFVLQNTVSPLAICILQNKTKLSLKSYLVVNACMVTQFVVTGDTIRESYCDVMGNFRWFSAQSLVLCPKLVFGLSAGFQSLSLIIMLLTLFFKWKSINLPHNFIQKTGSLRPVY